MKIGATDFEAKEIRKLSFSKFKTTYENVKGFKELEPETREAELLLVYKLLGGKVKD